MSNEECNLRMQQLEFNDSVHAKELKTHAALIAAQGGSLAKISGNLLQIKWLVIGALVGLLLDKVGLLEAISILK